MFFQNQNFFIKKEENKKKVYSPLKIAYLDHSGLVEIKKIALAIIILEIPLIQVEGILNLK